MTPLNDHTYDDYNSRASRLLGSLNRQPSAKADYLHDRLAGLIGSDSPRLISTVHEADAYIKVSNADAVGPEARRRLAPLMAHYAKEPHPFTACVADNTKRFGPDRAAKICAVLKDLMVGNTRWRSGGKKSTDSLDAWVDEACAAIAAELQHPDEVVHIEQWLTSMMDTAGKRFDPHQLRNPHTGEWSTGGAGGATAAPAAHAPHNPRFTPGRPVGPGRTWAEAQPGDIFEQPAGKPKVVADVTPTAVVFTEGGRVPKTDRISPLAVYRGQNQRKPIPQPPDDPTDLVNPSDFMTDFNLDL